MSVKPIFLFSLPRSGSTLLQRILASHPKISTCSEPWLLLPFVYALKPYGTFTEYSHSIGSRAVTEFLTRLPRGEEDYFASLREFTLSLYARAADPGALYFLDKTPRYYLIIPEIAKIFPDAKFVFLFRNPLHVLSSIIKTWLQGRMRLEHHSIDLFQGPRLLAGGYHLLEARSFALRYEDIVRNPDKTLGAVFSYLDLDYDRSLLHKFHELKLTGRMGDPTGVNEYREIDAGPLNKWKEVLNSRFRKKYALKYLAQIGEDTLRTFGFTIDELTEEVGRIKNSKNWGMADRIDLLFCAFSRVFEVPLFKRKRKERLMHRNRFTIHF